MESDGLEHMFMLFKYIHSQLSRCCAARGTSVEVLRVVPPKWGLVSSVLFSLVSVIYKGKTTKLILLSHYMSEKQLFAHAQCNLVGISMFTFIFATHN